MCVKQTSEQASQQAKKANDEEEARRLKTNGRRACVLPRFLLACLCAPCRNSVAAAAAARAFALSCPCRSASPSLYCLCCIARRRACPIPSICTFTYSPHSYLISSHQASPPLLPSPLISLYNRPSPLPARSYSTRFRARFPYIIHPHTQQNSHATCRPSSI